MLEPVSQNLKSHPFRQLVCLLAIVAAGAVIVIWVRNRLDELPPGVTRSDYKRAAIAYRSVYSKSPSRMDVLSYLGELAVAEGNLELAASAFRAIPVSDEQYGLSARVQLGQILIKMNRACEAEAALREFLEFSERSSRVRNADLVVALQWLKYLMSVELRLEERSVFLARLHALERASVFDSKQYYFPHLLLWETVKGRDELREFLEEAPDDRRLLVAEGRYLTGEGRLQQARLHLEELMEQAPDDRDCLAALLECHYERNDWESFQQVLQRGPAVSPDEPWLLLLMKGEFALHQEDWKAAAGHFEKLLAEEPAHVTACLGLSRAYGRLGRTDQSRLLQERTRVLSRIRPQLVDVTESNPSACEELADRCESIGYAEAAAAFRRHAHRISRQARRPRHNSHRPSSKRHGDRP